ncbi:hypothetical protein ACLOJK_029018, partial [Asimina triloba]
SGDLIFSSYQYTAGVQKFGAPSSPKNCRPTQRRRVSDRPIQSGQKDSSNISVLDPSSVLPSSSNPITAATSNLSDPSFLNQAKIWPVPKSSKPRPNAQASSSSHLISSLPNQAAEPDPNDIHRSQAVHSLLQQQIHEQQDTTSSTVSQRSTGTGLNQQQLWNLDLARPAQAMTAANHKLKSGSNFRKQDRIA